MSELAVLQRLREALPESVVIDDPAVIAEHSHDHGSYVSVPDATILLRPTSTEEVATALAIASELNVPVVPQGSRTGLAGGANAVPGAILLNLSGMTKIHDINVENQSATLEAGVIINDINVAAAPHGLFFPPDPGSVYVATIGGAVATNAGGMRCVKYGITRNFVRKLTVVLASGEVIKVGQDTVKGVAGYDLLSLFVGSEGTLGIITEITVGLLPLPGEAATLMATFDDVQDALAAATAIMQLPQRPSSLEFLDEFSAQAIADYDPNSVIPADANAVLIIESDDDVRGASDIERYEAAIAPYAPKMTVLGSTTEEAKRILDARRNWHYAMYTKFPELDSEDVSLPRAQLGKMITAIQDIERSTGVPIIVGGHVGDGNLHPLIPFDSSSAESLEKASQAKKLMMDAALALGGTVSGEHGIGILKRDALDIEFPPVVRSLQRAIKAVFDMQGILNPGKKL